MSAHQKSPPLSELTPRQVQWIAAGYMMTLATMPGQTIFIAQFNPSLRELFSLSHGQLGGLYTIATLASALCLAFAGVLADRIGARRLTLASLIGLALVALLMASLDSVLLLVVAFAGLRFCGQGMLAHVTVTTMSRWFNRFRGRALSFAGLGFTTGEALIPFTITLAIAAFGWREVWVGTALALLLILAPVIYFLLRDPPDGRRALAAGIVNPDGTAQDSLRGSQWTRARVLRDPLFYLVIAGITAPPAIGTLFIFHQAHLAALKGWDLTVFTAFFPVTSVTVVVTSLVSGFLIDRFGAWRLMSVLLLPLGLAALIVATLTPVWSIPVFFVAFGMSTGLMAPVMGALWAEMYGTVHLGAIRALASSALVAASAVGPGIAGFLIDAGLELDLQGYIYAAYCIAGTLLFVMLRSAFRRRVAELAAAG